MTPKQKAAVDALVEALYDAMDEALRNSPDLSRKIDALRALGIDLNQIKLGADVFLSAQDGALKVGVPMNLAEVTEHVSEGGGSAFSATDASFLRSLRIRLDPEVP